ncbi:MAG TPA: hypothetical protein VKR32_12630 [Puia sp.]|nr:hypothetical protein [Puia sp.]
MPEDNFSPEDSIQVIQSMIDKTKASVADNSFYFLLWGWLVFVACVSQFVLKVIVDSRWHPIVWSVNIIGIVLSIYHSVHEERKRRVRNYIDECLDYLWISIVVSYVLFGLAFARIGWENCYTFYMMLYGLGSFVTGRLLKVQPLVWGAIASWALAVVSTFTRFDINILLCAAAILFSYIIPGYLLRKKYREQH